MTVDRGLSSLRWYLDGLAKSDWTQAFQSAFGTGSDAFYSTFARQQAGFRRPARNPCGFAYDE